MLLTTCNSRCLAVLVLFLVLNQSTARERMSNHNEFQSTQLKPQEPVPPFPYRTEDVTYENQEAGITLAGTLTLPFNNNQANQLKYPAVVLIAGYGPSDRDLTRMGHKTFLVLSDYLTRQGIAVLRVDKRGVGQSTGDLTTATSKDLADDVRAGIEFLKSRADINQSQIGLIGLSEGGLIASMIAAHSKDIAFIVLMAPAIATSTEDLVDLIGLQLRADGASDEFIRKDHEVRYKVYSVVRQERDAVKAENVIRKLLADYFKSLSEEEKQEAEKLPFAFTPNKAETLITVFNGPWYRFFLAHNTTQVLESINVPVLVLNGDRDWIMTPEKAFPALRSAFERSGNSNYKFVELSGLNHAFQTCRTGALTEYATIKETLAPVVLKTIGDWILAETSQHK